VTVSDYAWQGPLKYCKLAFERVSVIGEASHLIFRVLPHVLTSEALRQRMRQAGLVAVRQFIWDAVAQQMHALLHHIGPQT
jgi:hypothetical protein